MKKLIGLMAALLMLFPAGCSEYEEIYTAQSYTASTEEVQEIIIDVNNRRVEVEISEDKAIHIEYAESEKEYYNISVSEGVLTMTTATNKRWRDYIGGESELASRTILLQIPSGLESLDISTTNEDISLVTLTVGNVSLFSNGGDVLFDEIDAESTITLRTKNGNITGSIIGGYDDFMMNCKVKKGDCNLPEAKTGGDKQLTVTANNGNVNIDFTPRDE